MKTPNVGNGPTDDEAKQLHARIIELQEEISRIRGAPEKPRRHTVEAFHEDDVLREVFNNISVCMFLVDITSDGRFRFAGFNPAEEEAVGLTNDQVFGKLVEEVFEEAVAQKMIRNYRRCVEAGASITFEDELDLPRGRRSFHSDLIPMRDAHGHIHRIVGACIDMTDLKRSQDEAVARQKLESLGVLAGGIAHDFNNLLGSILAQAELAETEIAVGSLPGQELQTIKGVATRAGEMVRELMVYSGQNETSLDVVDLSRLVEEMLELLKISISKHATLKVDLPKNLPAIRASAVQIRQVVMNLITNASEALGEQEGVISISIVKLGSDQDPVAGGEPGFLRLEVSDTGYGMSPETLERIFDPFFTTKFAGRGLGLAAVQGIIRSHGGTINVVSASGQGSRFEILLPCIDQSAQDTADIAAPASNREPGSLAGTILVVEDEEILRIAVSKMLRKEQFAVIEVGDGTAAASVFAANASKIDVVLLDVTLPGMSGREVLEEMRRIRPDIKVIFMSAFSEDNAVSALGESPRWGYLRKPYLFSELVSLLREACPDRSRSNQVGS